MPATNSIPATHDLNAKHFRAACIRVLGPNSPDPTRIDRIVSAIATRAENGDSAAFQAIRDTLDGKPTQEISGPNGGPISMEFRTFYEPLLAGSGPTIEHEPTQIGPQSSGEGPQEPENAG